MKNQSEQISVSRILFCGAQCHQNPRTSGKKSFYQREMTSSGTRLRFTVIAVNMETEGQVSWRVFINWDGVISVPAVAWPLFPAGLLGFASDYGLQGNHFPFLPLCLCCAAAQVYSVRSKPSLLINKSLKPDLITSWSTAVVSDRVLDEIFPSSALTGPVKHWHSGKRMMKCRFVNTKIPWLYTSPVQMSHKYLSKFPM